MNDHELKQLWREQPPFSPAHATDQELADRMKKMMRRFDRTILWRDAREIGACVIVALLAGLGLLRQASMMTRIGNIIVILSCLVIALTLTVVRRGRRGLSPDRSLRDSLQAEIAKVSGQLRLLQTVVWWYAAPLLAGAALAELGHQGGIIGKIVVMLILVAAGWFVHWFNQHGVNGLLRLKAELERTLNSVPEFAIPTQDDKPEGEAV